MPALVSTSVVKQRLIVSACESYTLGFGLLPNGNLIGSQLEVLHPMDILC